MRIANIFDVLQVPIEQSLPVPELGGNLYCVEGYQVAPPLPVEPVLKEELPAPRVWVLIVTRTNDHRRQAIVLATASETGRLLQGHTESQVSGQRVQACHGSVLILDRAGDGRGPIICPTDTQIFLVPINPRTNLVDLACKHPCLALFFESGFIGWRDYGRLRL